jgi:hypothetical protein
VDWYGNSMTLPDERLPVTRHAVEQLFGQCVLRLQAHELLMKSIVAGHQLSAPMTDLEDAQSDRAAETGRKTMGGLVSELMGSFVVPEGQEGPHDPQRDAPFVAFKFQLAFPAEDFARIEAEHRNLVLLRNTLVHHFLEQHDLRAEDGCLAAQQTLTDALDRVARAFADLCLWAEEMERTRKALADHPASPDLHDFIVHGRVPWHITTIAQALQEASMVLGMGDWTPVDAATCWISERHPEEQPQSYGCRSWRQVIHETGQFDLQVHKVGGRRQARYRPRNRGTAQL